MTGSAPKVCINGVINPAAVIPETVADPSETRKITVINQANTIGDILELDIKS